MCGFIGFFDHECSSTDKKNILKQMNNKIIHRGPNSEGTFIDDDIALGFRRLSIIDLESGDQPIFNEDKSLIIIFNGEIYNYKEIRNELINLGHTFSTKTDTEVILHGYEEWGENLLTRLRGMFAFVIYNRKNKEIFGARDYFGIKPFYYSFMNKTFIFGSEIKSFLCHPSFKKELNKESLKMYLIFQYSVLDETFFKNVFKLKPGHYFKLKNNKFTINTYFTPQFDEKEKPLKEIEDMISKAVEQSVQYHKRSDVEIGSFLSAGVDSSYIAAIAKPHKTYTVGFAQDGFDETSQAKDLSNILKIKNISQLISPDEFFDALPKIQYFSDEPHANLSAVPLYFLSKLAAKDVKVALSGEGADEFFGGYLSYSESSIAFTYRKFFPLPIRKLFKKLAKKFPNIRGSHFLIKNGEKLEDSYIGQAFIMDNDEANTILSEKYKSNLTFQDITKPIFDKVKDKDDIIKKMYLDLHLWLPNDILLKADKMTMANSLELRVPYLDIVLFNVAKTLKPEHLVHHGVTKFAFRKCAMNKLPEEWSKRKKIGFMVPFSNWIKEEKYYNKVRDLFNEDFVSEFFNKTLLLNILKQHYEQKKNYGRKIYTIYSFLIWYKEYFL